MLELRGRTVSKTVDINIGLSILEHALAHSVDIGFSCTRGTCARCRCRIVEGGELLSETTKAEFDRMDEEEIAEGYRLGCQAVFRSAGKAVVRNETYF